MPSLFAHKTFISIVNRESTSRLEPLGTHKSTLDLYLMSELEIYRYFVCEWDIPTANEFASIGLWVTDNELTDYDGVFSLPVQVIELLESKGIKVGEDFRDE